MSPKCKCCDVIFALFKSEMTLYDESQNTEWIGDNSNSQPVGRNAFKKGRTHHRLHRRPQRDWLTFESFPEDKTSTRKYKVHFSTANQNIRIRFSRGHIVVTSLSRFFEICTVLYSAVQCCTVQWSEGLWSVYFFLFEDEFLLEIMRSYLASKIWYVISELAVNLTSQSQALYPITLLPSKYSS